MIDMGLTDTDEVSDEERPPGYPREFERGITLRDGRRARVRPVLPSDAPRLEDAFKHADPETLYRRFLGTPPQPRPALFRFLCTVDYRTRFALIAEDPATGDGIAIARYEPVRSGVADVAVAVDPKWRGAGLAEALVILLAEAAMDRGIEEFTAEYFGENRPVAALARLAGRPEHHAVCAGVVEDEIRLPTAVSARGPGGAAPPASGGLHGDPRPGTEHPADGGPRGQQHEDQQGH